MHDEQERGTWSDSEAERLLRAVLKYSKQYIHDKGKWLLNQICFDFFFINSEF